MIETLETRCMMTGLPLAPVPPIALEPVELVSGTLNVRGGSGSDTISIGFIDAGLYNVRINRVDHFVMGWVSRIVVDARAGNDTVIADARFSIPITMYGGAGDDTLGGAGAADRLAGGYGSDSIAGGAGNDVISGGPDNDRLFGDGGADTLGGDEGHDVLAGGPGSDVMNGGDGLDKVTYRDGRVLGVFAIIGADRSSGTPALRERDSIRADVETLEGSDAGDTLWGSAGPDSIGGAAGNDLIYGLRGRDLIDAGAGNDTIDGGNDDDYMNGNDGNDRQVGGGGNDQLSGGHGNDSIYGMSGNDSLGGGAGSDLLWAGVGDDNLSGGAGADSIHGDDGNDQILGGDGADELFAGAGNDRLDGGAQNDTLIAIGGGNTDTVFGGIGSDALWCDPDATERHDATAGEIADGFLHRVAAFRNAVAYDPASDTITASMELLGQDILDPQGPAGMGTTNFSRSPLFAAGGPVKTDVNQGSVGDCWFMAPLSSVADVDPQRIRNSVVALGDGTFAVRFYDDGAEAYYRVDGDLPTDAGGNLIYARPGANGAIWGAIMEKAFVFARAPSEVTIPITKDPIFGITPVDLSSVHEQMLHPSYEVIAGGWADEGFERMGLADINDEDDFDSPGDMAAWIDSQLLAGRAVTFCTDDEPQPRFAGEHCYYVDAVSFVAGGAYITMRNPWGFDGRFGDRTPSDGEVTVFAADLYESWYLFTSAAT